MEPYPGADLGTYRVERKVGEGAYGAVWCAAHRETGERVALKVLLPAAAANPEQVSRFDREAKLLALVRSPNVARMVDVLVDSEFGVVLVMEFIDGELMSDLLDAGRLSVRETLEIGTQILDGVCDLHEAGIVHRDLKPNNIMLCSRADGSRRVVIFDLGLSRMVRAVAAAESTRSLTGSHVALGTLECMAPEQILNARDVTERSDIYAVGSILFCGITGSYPFTSDDERDLARRKLTVETPEMVISTADPLAEPLRAIIMKATRRRPAQRYATAREMRDDFKALRASAKAPVSTAATPATARPAPSASLPEEGERSHRARLPTVTDEDRLAPPRTWSERLTPVVIGIAVFCALVGAALFLNSRHP